IERRDGFLRPGDVLGLLHRSSDAARGGRRTADRAGRNGLPAQKRADDRRTDRDRGLNTLTRRLLAFRLDHLIRATKFFLEPRLAGRVLAPELVERAIAFLPRPV